MPEGGFNAPAKAINIPKHIRRKAIRVKVGNQIFKFTMLQRDGNGTKGKRIHAIGVTIPEIKTMVSTNNTVSFRMIPI